MYVTTSQAAIILAMGSRRLRQLLQEGRVRGAYKSGSIWLIPLFENGLPQIIKGNRGPVGTWKTKQKPVQTVVHVNRNKIRANKNKSKQHREPVLSIKQGRHNTYASQVEIPGPCRIVYQPDKPLACGAQVWIETWCPELHLIKSD